MLLFEFGISVFTFFGSNILFKFFVVPSRQITFSFYIRKFTFRVFLILEFLYFLTTKKTGAGFSRCSCFLSLMLWTKTLLTLFELFQLSICNCSFEESSINTLWFFMFFRWLNCSYCHFNRDLDWTMIATAV